MKPATERKRKERAAKKAQGLSKLELWLPKQLHQQVKELVKKLNTE